MGDNHDEKVEGTNLEKAGDFMSSERGRYILSQALHFGIKALKEVQPDVMQEKSNIADMEYLRETIFNVPSFLFDEQMSSNLTPVRVPKLDGLVTEFRRDVN